MKAYFLLAVCILTIACSNSEMENFAAIDINDSIDHPNFVTINSSGKTVTLGTDDPEAKLNEQTPMEVLFTYNFLFEKKEVTCGEFFELISNKKLNQNKSNFCISDAYPISNVTFYDAVLYANALSKKESFDTAYTYTSASFDNEGHCYGLEGFAYHPEKEAYRLPTEAEWTLVAQSNWNINNAWTAANSDFMPHAICSGAQKDEQICDIAGNLMEWTNDWLVFFKDTTVINFAGAPDGGGVGERILKGGSFRNNPQSIHIYSRGDVYTVTSSTKADYVGFRLAFGSIPNPTWINRSGLTSESRVYSLVNSSTIRSKTGSIKTKLVFRNDITGHLNYIDYSNANPTIVEINDSLDAYHPDISPDGNYVAFCTGLEGVSGKSILYVLSLNAKNKSPIKLNVESAAIPRWHIFENNDTSIVYVSSAANNKDSATFLTNSTWKVSFSNGKFGTPQKILDGNYHGGISQDLRLAVTGASVLRVRIASKDSNFTVFGENAQNTIWLNGEQACNTSLSKDSTMRTLFLDFGSKTGQDFTQSNYKTHERILIASKDGNLIQSIKAPSNYTFDHTEWISGNNQTDSRFIVATLANINGAHQKIVLVDIADSSITDLISGEELWHPAMWTKSGSNMTSDDPLNYDSAGIYYNENANYPAYELRSKMESFWNGLDSFTAVALGSSRTLFGLDEKQIKKEKLLNFGYSGGDFYGYDFLLNYIVTHMQNVKYLVLELSPNMFWRKRSTDWESIYEICPGFKYDESHDFWKNGIPKNLFEAIHEGPTLTDKSTLPYKEEFSLASKSWGNPDCESAIEYMFIEDSLPQYNFKVFTNIISKAKAANLKIIALIYPVNPKYKDTETFSLHGPSRDVAKQIVDIVSGMGVIIMDENKWGEHDYNDDMANDTDHLSYLGAIQLAKRLDKFLSNLSQK